ncbi:ProQ/FinO family protein [Photorhabdus temperata]|uniref:Activator of osmoprotectant transporter ProP n=1 Tax=Photorhabdus temperata subsp. temperata Meg1 TaxID=1393735 RepID=A0A081RXC0_PHOTE|nr:ProQ/FINO family protein [Photorhabdus temperata]KER03323.1 activator of osmoprotectant transporter ProP [Photorhabdus temperata subsp. temperata Meg1]MCT8346780.1 ProQ/FinO family protein [Photorhabdus temperata]
MNKRSILTLKRKTLPPASEAPKVAASKMAQNAPEQPKKTNKADIHAKRKQHRIDRIAKHWALFSEPEVRPLMIDIDQQMMTDVIARGLDVAESHIKQGIHSYVNRRAYLKALILGGSRFDMNGQPDGEVTPEQQEAAEQKLKGWQQTKPQ